MVAQFSHVHVPFPYTDQEQAARQLQYLGRKPEDARLRFFYHGTDPRKNDDKGRKLEGMQWEAIARYQRDNRGVYLVINQGGHEDKDIVECCAIFCEWDDCPVAEQLLRWSAVGFLEPTFTVYSGDKSAQPYWVFDRQITVKQWRELQLLVIEVMGADPANKNPSRVFRQAGGWHCKPGREPVRTEIVQDSGIKYSYEQVRSRLLELKAINNPSPVTPLIPEQSPGAPDIVKLIGEYVPLRECGGDLKGDCPFCNAVSQFIVKSRTQTFECFNCQSGGDADNYASTSDDFLKKYQRTFSGGNQRIRYKDISCPVPSRVPLEVCLSKESRALLESGVSQGGRNTQGAKLARDLIGTASYLQSIGQRYEGDARRFLDDYAARCNPPLPEKEVEAIWRSASKDRPGPSCKPEGVEACIRGWYWNQHIKPHQIYSSGSNGSGSSGSGGLGGGRGFGSGSGSGSGPGSGGGSGGGGDNNPPGFAVTLCEQIKKILRRYDSQSMRDAALMDLAAGVDRNFRELEQLAKILELETELSDDAIKSAQSLGKLLKTRRISLKPEDYFERGFAEQLQATADAMPTAVEYLITTFLPSAATCIGTSSRVIVKPSAGYIQPLVIWSAIIGQSGALKTPAQKAIIKPLIKLEALYYEQYKEALKDYSEQMAYRKAHASEVDGEPEPIPPVRQRLVTKDCTIEQLQRIHGDNSRGILYYRDELAGGAKSRNQYRGGFGADFEAELDQFNGAEIIYDRGDKQVFLPNSCIPRTGGYQWEVAAQMMDENGDYTGMNARWLLDAASSPKPYIDLLSPDADIDTGLGDTLIQLYTQLRNLPDGDYLLSHEAKVLFQAFQHQSVDEAEAEDKLGLQVVYPKNQSYVSRLALLLHIVNATLRGETPAPVISGETMLKAISLAGYYLWQYRMIYKHNHPDSGLEGLGLKAHRFAQKAGHATASTVKRGVSAFKKVVVGTIRQVFESLATSGWGRIEGSGENMIYIPNEKPKNQVKSPVDRVDRVDTKLSLVSTAQSPPETGGQTKVDKIDEIDTTHPLDIETGLDEPHSSQPDSIAGENNQFINSLPLPPMGQDIQPVDDNTQCDHQPSTESSQSDSQLADEEELLNDDAMASWYQRLNACQTLDDATEFYTAMEALPFAQRHQFESSVPDSLWAWLFNLPELQQRAGGAEGAEGAEGAKENCIDSLTVILSSSASSAPSAPPALSSPSSISSPQLESVKEPTLEELKALLLACNTLAALNELKRTHQKTIGKAYRALTEKEQVDVDALAALAVPHKVFKYLGDEIRLSAERLLKGTLVYIDPRTHFRSTARSVLVWAINGVSSGWLTPIEVSFSLLREVVKVQKPNEDLDGNQQLGLI